MAWNLLKAEEVGRFPGAGARVFHRHAFEGTDMQITFVEPKPPGMHVFSRVHLPRLGPVLLATILARAGHQTSVVLEESAPIDWGRLWKADLVGISTITSTAPRAYAIADRLRSQGVPVVLGGAHPTFLPDEGLEHADWVVRGEGDAVIVPFVEAVARGSGFESVPGLSWRKEGCTVHNLPGPPVKDLDTLPAPDLSLIPHKAPGLFDFVASHTLPLQTSRGCPYDCSFCSVTSMFGRKYRFRSARPVVDELRSRDFAGAHVFFYDDNFTANPARARELLQAMIDAKIRPEWSTQVHTDCARHPGLLQLMRRAGCETVYVGFESINPRTLELYDKTQTVEGMERAIAAIHGAGIRVHGMFVFGSDADDRETIRRTARWAVAREIDSVQFLILTPLPGTRVFDDLERAGRLLTRDWSLYDTHHVVFRPSKMSPYTLQMETLRAQSKFYSPAQILVSVLRGHRFNAYIRLYAAHHNRAWMKTHGDFLNRLREAGDERAVYFPKSDGARQYQPAVE
jgi:radical SAM superfamily enzyme YgiQ (UPF0313 family)